MKNPCLSTLMSILCFSGLAVFAEPAAVPPQPVHAPVKIEIEPGVWGKGGPADIGKVVSSAANAIWQHCDSLAIHTINLRHMKEYPLCAYSHDQKDRTVIFLTSQDTYWSQYAYQFSHEFCHLLAGHAEPYTEQWKNEGKGTKWLEESLCEMASLFALRSMASSWKTQPPYPNWASYSDALKKYSDDLLDNPKRSLPPGTAFVDWLATSLPEMQKNSTSRDKNAVVAKQLLPLFEKDPKGWQCVAFLNRTPPAQRETESLEQRLNSWHAACPNDLKPFVASLAKEFGIGIK